MRVGSVKKMMTPAIIFAIFLGLTAMKWDLVLGLLLAKILNKNGLIMYITCSLQKIEGERRIEKFLLEQNKFSIIPFTTNDYPMLENCVTKEGFIRILPNSLNFKSNNVTNGSDGFFVSLLRMDK